MIETDTCPIKRMHELREVSRSGFYQWRAARDRGTTQRSGGDELDAKVAASHAASDGVYGAPRILADLRAAGERASRKDGGGLATPSTPGRDRPRAFAPATTVADPYAPLPKDLVGRRSDTGVLDRVWTSDITYLRTGQGWLYLCAVRDGCSRRVSGWAIDEHMRTDLFESALAMAVAMRGELAETVIVHADYAEVCVKPRVCGDGLRSLGGAGGFLGLTFRVLVSVRRISTSVDTPRPISWPPTPTSPGNARACYRRWDSDETRPTYRRTGLLQLRPRLSPRLHAQDQRAVTENH